MVFDNDEEAQVDTLVPMQAAAAVADAIEQRRDGNGEATLSTGVVIRHRPVPPWLAREVVQKIKDPEIPIMYLESKGRDEPNPNDPKYIQALEDVNVQRGIASLDIVILMGTEITHVPEGIIPMESDEWIDQLRDLEVFDEETFAKIQSSKNQRKIAWFKFYIIKDNDDFAKLMGQEDGSGGNAGLGEAEVESSMRSFQNRETRRANRGRPPKNNNVNGHKV